MTQSRGIENHLDQLRSSGAQIQKDVGEFGKEVGRAAYDQVEQISDTAQTYVRRGREQAEDMAGTLQDQIRAQPIRSVLIAAGIGFLASALWMRR